MFKAPVRHWQSCQERFEPHLWKWSGLLNAVVSWYRPGVEGSSLAACCSPSAEDVPVISFLLTGPLCTELCFCSVLTHFLEEVFRSCISSWWHRAGAGQQCQVHWQQGSLVLLMFNICVNDVLCWDGTNPQRLCRRYQVRLNGWLLWTLRLPFRGNTVGWRKGPDKPLEI